MPAPRRREPAEEPAKPAKAHDTGVFALGALAALLVIAAVFFLVRSLQQPVPSPPAPAEQAAAPASKTDAPGAAPTPVTPRVPKPAAQPKSVRTAAPSGPAVSAGINVSVETNPAGAGVIFDSDPQNTCQSPCSVTLPPGRHTAAATLAGHRQALKIFTLPQDASLSIGLDRMAGMVRIGSDPPGAAILVDGQPRAEKTPATISLPAGSHTVTVRKEGFRNAEQELEVKDGAFLSLQFDFSK
jgi:hypothetical protein